MYEKNSGTLISERVVGSIEGCGWFIDTIKAHPEKAHVDNRARPSSTERSSSLQGSRDTGVMGSGIEMEESGTAKAQDHAVKHRHDRGLLAIGLLKLIEAVFFFLVGAGAIHFLHHDLGDAATRLAERLKFDLDGRMMTWVMDHLDDITAHRLKQIGVATFFYAGLRIAEGVGLILEKVWAEYL